MQHLDEDKLNGPGFSPNDFLVQVKQAARDSVIGELAAVVAYAEAKAALPEIRAMLATAEAEHVEQVARLEAAEKAVEEADRVHREAQAARLLQRETAPAGALDLAVDRAANGLAEAQGARQTRLARERTARHRAANLAAQVARLEGLQPPATPALELVFSHMGVKA